MLGAVTLGVVTGGGGGACGVAVTDAAGPGPTLFSARSSKVYSVPLVRLPTVSVKSVPALAHVSGGVVPVS